MRMITRYNFNLVDQKKWNSPSRRITAKCKNNRECNTSRKCNKV